MSHDQQSSPSNPERGEQGERYPTRFGRGWIPAERDIGLPGEVFSTTPRAGAAGPAGAPEKYGEREGDGPRIHSSSSSSSGVRHDDASCDAASGPGFRRDDLGGRPASGWDGDDFAAASTRGWDAGRKVRFLHALALKGDVRAACARVGMSRQSAYVLRRRDGDFARGWAGALVLARDHAEEVLATRALDGVEEAVWFHGEQVGVRRRHDARLLLAHLARLDRQAEALLGLDSGEELAGRFDEVLAMVAGTRPEAAFFERDDLMGAQRSALPLERHTFANAVSEDMERRGSGRYAMSGVGAVAETCGEECGVECGGDSRGACGEDALPPGFTEDGCFDWRLVQGLAGEEWDAWRGEAFGVVDALLGAAQGDAGRQGACPPGCGPEAACDAGCDAVRDAGSDGTCGAGFDPQGPGALPPYEIKSLEGLARLAPDRVIGVNLAGAMRWAVSPREHENPGFPRVSGPVSHLVDGTARFVANGVESSMSRERTWPLAVIAVKAGAACPPPPPPAAPADPLEEGPTRTERRASARERAKLQRSPPTGSFGSRTLQQFQDDGPQAPAPPARRGGQAARSVVGEKGQLDDARAAADQADLAGGGLAEVDHAVAVERAAVVDGDDDALAVGRVGDLHLRAEGQGAVRGGQRFGIEELAAGGRVAGKAGAVVAGAALAIGLEFGLGRDGQGLDHGLRDGECACGVCRGRLGDRCGSRDGGCADGSERGLGDGRCVRVDRSGEGQRNQPGHDSDVSETIDRQN